MKNFICFISFLIMLLAFSCNANLSTEPEENSSIESRNEGFKTISAEDLDGTWWEVANVDDDGFAFDYPLDQPWGWFDFHPDRWERHQNGTPLDDDPDKDGVKEWAELYSYYYFKDNKISTFEKIIVIDEGDVQGEFNNFVGDFEGKPLTTGELYLSYDQEFIVKNGKVYLKDNDVTKEIFIDKNDDNIMYEKCANNRIVTLKKVNYEDIK